MKIYEIDNDSIVEIDKLIDVVLDKGAVKTGLDIFNYNDHLLIPGKLLIKDTKVLKRTKTAGIKRIPIQKENGGGIWDENGESILHKFHKKYKKITDCDVEKQVKNLIQQKTEAHQGVNVAKTAVKKVIHDIRSNGGRFEYNEVEDTVVKLIDVISETENPYSLLARNIFSYDDYLLNHSISVCTIGTAVLYQVNRLFKDLKILGKKSKTANQMLKLKNHDGKSDFYSIDEIKQISIGYFLHDIGKVAVSENLLNKQGSFTEKEFATVKKHSYEYGKVLLNKNGIKNKFIENSVMYHHGPLYEDESRTYPDKLNHIEIPEYVKICKLTDIYDAMTSKRAYKDAINPAEVITSLYKNYAYKCNQLQLILHSFVKSIGNVPPGTIIQLKNKQTAFVLDSQGPVIILLTDQKGDKLKKVPDPVNLSDSDSSKKYEIDPTKRLSAPMDAYNVLPNFLKRMYET